MSWFGSLHCAERRTQLPLVSDASTVHKNLAATLEAFVCCLSCQAAEWMHAGHHSIQYASPVTVMAWQALLQRSEFSSCRGMLSRIEGGRLQVRKMTLRAFRRAYAAEIDPALLQRVDCCLQVSFIAVPHPSLHSAFSPSFLAASRICFPHSSFAPSSLPSVLTLPRSPHPSLQSSPSLAFLILDQTGRLPTRMVMFRRCISAPAHYLNRHVIAAWTVTFRPVSDNRSEPRQTQCVPTCSLPALDTCVHRQEEWMCSWHLAVQSGHM